MKRIGVSGLLGVAWVLSVTLSGTHALAADTALRTVAPESEICKNCHAPYVESYLASKHGQPGNLRGPDCLTCHGESALEHAKLGGGRGVGGIFGFNNKAIPAAKKSAVCLSCHEGNRQLTFWDSGQHKKNDVSCNNCHSLHGKPGPGSTIALKNPNPSISPFVTTVRQLQYETCGMCHRDIVAQLNKFSHHPIIEGKVKCTDCHNPHGALSPHMVNADTIVDLCRTCHADKRGPFIWSHPPVEENCTTCHTPHGSSHPKMTVERVPSLCSDCHDATFHPSQPFGGGVGLGGPGAPAVQLVGRACLNCHTNIHGSNAPGRFGQIFIR